MSELPFPVHHTQNAITPETVLAALGHGKALGMKASELVFAITGRPSAAAEERHLREVIVALRKAGHPVCGRPEEGYYIGVTAEELDGTCGFLVDRAMTTLTQVSAMRRVTLPDLRGQLGLPLRKETI